MKTEPSVIPLGNGVEEKKRDSHCLRAGSMEESDVDREFDYDTPSRLITARVTDTQDWSTGTEKTTWYNYDDLGNRISHRYRDATAIGYGHDKANRMTTYATKTQGYDQAGNLTGAFSADRATAYTYSYDHHNRLTKIEDDATSTRKAAFTYDALGRRIEVINDTLSQTVRYYYDGVNEIVETDESANDLRYGACPLCRVAVSRVHGRLTLDIRMRSRQGQVMMDFKDTADGDDDRPYYYTIDRMYNP